MSEIPKIVKLLTDPAHERRLAAAVVLGALKTKAPEAREALLTVLENGGPKEQRAAIEALASIGSKTVIVAILPLLVSPDVDVKDAAVVAVSGFGDVAVPVIEQARDHAPDDLKRALDLLLARLGGGTAFHALLENLVSASGEVAREAVLEVRHRIKNAPPADRKDHLTQTLKFLKRKEVRANDDALIAAVKILGFVEDKKAVPPLLDLLADDVPRVVKLEIIIALRFALGHERDAPDVVDALMTVIEGGDRDLGRTAMDTLGNLQIPAAVVGKLTALAKGAGPERGRFAIAALGSIDDKKAKQALVDVLLEGTLERAEHAAHALDGEALALAPVLAALPTVVHAERAVLLSQIVRSRRDAVTKPQLQKLLDAMTTLIAAGTPGYESVLRVAREIDGEKVGDALRTLAADLKKKKKADKASLVLELLARSGEGSADDRFKQAMMALQKSKKDTSPTSRTRDPSLKILEELVNKGVDVISLLKKERTVDIEARFYLGFHFIELGEPIGEDLLNEVIEKGGRTKLAKMAKNKLKLEQVADA